MGNCDEIKLVKPTAEYGKEIMEFRREIIAANDRDAFAGCGELQKCRTVKAWLQRVSDMENPVTCPVGRVAADLYLAVRIEDNRVVGMIDLRHSIDHPALKLWGGHIGYSIRPSERNKGYAKEMLRQNLQKCKERKMDKVMITCSRENTASEKTILANGGVFEKEVAVDGEVIKRYWITL